MKYKTIFLTIFLLIVLIGISNADDILVAILEQPQCKENSYLMVRVLFTKMNGKWVAIVNAKTAESYDFSKMKWIAAFDGQNIGQVKTLDLKTEITPERHYPRDKLLQITAGTPVPKLLNKEEEFYGWCGAPKFRPIVLVSKSNFKDPTRWNPFSPPQKICNQLFSEFKKVVGSVSRCLNAQESNSIPYVYQARDLLLFKSYQNALGQKLVSIGLDPKTYNCDGPLDPAWTPHWFLVDNKIRYIDNELELIDVGDYDNNGKSEVIFWHSGYNEDGYTLFYDDFNGRVNFYWNYH